LFLLRRIILIFEEAGMDERYLKLLFFDVSEITKPNSCGHFLHFYDIRLFEYNFECSFKTDFLSWVGYLAVSYQLCALLVAIIYRRRHPSERSLPVDLMLVFEVRLS
jgi:hypothetical protein